MGVRQVWERGYTGRGVVITILDDGIEHTHSDLVDNYVSKSGKNKIQILISCFVRVTKAK